MEWNVAPNTFEKYEPKIWKETKQENEIVRQDVKAEKTFFCDRTTWKCFFWFMINGYAVQDFTSGLMTAEYTPEPPVEWKESYHLMYLEKQFVMYKIGSTKHHNQLV